MTHEEWPMLAVIERRDDKGEWKHYSQIRSIEDAEVWIAKRPDPENWRSQPIGSSEPAEIAS